MLIVVRRFGADGLGRTALAQSILSYALTVGLWGTDLFAIQRVAARPIELWRTIRLVRLTRICAALAAYVGMLALTMLVPGFRDVLPLVALFGLSVFAAAMAPEWVPQSQHRTHITGIASLTTQGIYLGLVVVAAVSGAALWSVAAAKVTADVCTMAGLLVWLYRSQVRGDVAEPTSEEVRRFAALSAPICATQLLRSVAITSDVVILGLMESRTDLGHYAGAGRLFVLMLTLATAYFVILLPRFAERAASVPQLEAELRASLRATVPLAIAALMVLIPLAAPILRLLFGAGFSDAAASLRVLGAAAACNLIGRHYRQVLLVRGRQATDFSVTVGGTMVHVVSKVLLIPLLGITGAAAGAMAGEGFMMLAHRLAARRDLRVPA